MFPMAIRRQRRVQSPSPGYDEYGQQHWPAATILWRLSNACVLLLTVTLAISAFILRYTAFIGDDIRCCLLGLWSAAATFCLVRIARFVFNLSARDEDGKRRFTKVARLDNATWLIAMMVFAGVTSMIVYKSACCGVPFSPYGHPRHSLGHTFYMTTEGIRVRFCPPGYYPTETAHGAPSKCVRTCPVTYSKAVEDAHSRSKCADDEQREIVTMVWTTSADTFGARNQWTVESIFKHHPCARIQVLSNELPLDFFDTFRYEYHFSIQVVRYDMKLGGVLVGPPGSPGTNWIAQIDKWRRTSSAFHVHLSDIVRLFALLRYGGTYVDFDHIVLKPMHLLPPNTIGSEICRDDNPDCLTAAQLLQLRVIAFQEAGWSGTRMAFSEGVRYTPCNGVMVNWEPMNPLIAAALQYADEHYDPSCWGCLGPRLFGRLLLESLSARPLIAAAVSIEPPARFYPFSYETAAVHLASRVDETEALLAAEEVMGAHFYGKVTTGAALHAESTMGQLVATHTLFGMHKWEWVVRRPDVKPCTIDTAGASGVAAHAEKWMRHHEHSLRALFDFFPSTITDFAFAASASSVLLICHPEWLGIREMTERIAIARKLPVIMPKGHDFTSDNHKYVLCEIIARFQIERVSIQGVPEGALTLVDKIYIDDCGTSTNGLVAHKGPWAEQVDRRSSIVYHSGIAVHNVATEEAELLGGLFKAASQSRLSLAFIEDDQTEYARSLGIPACTLWPTFIAGRSVSGTRIEEGGIKKALAKEKTLNLGLLGFTRPAVKCVDRPFRFFKVDRRCSDTSSLLLCRNLFPQLGAACMFEGSLIHVTALDHIPRETRDSWHLNFCKGRIIEHGRLTPLVFANELGKKDINFYVTVTDAVPNVVLDSLAMGVPVIVSDVTSIFRFSPFLHDLLVESRIDDPVAIFNRAKSVLAYVRDHADEYAMHVDKLLSDLDEQAHKSWDCYESSSVKVTMCMNRDGRCEPLSLSVPPRSVGPV